MRSPDGPADLLARLARSAPARPFVTYYDLATGARVELSVATFENWVSKTAGLLIDELDVAPGDTVSVALPAHWLGLVWAMGVWTVGAHLALGPAHEAAVSVRAAPEHADAPGVDAAQGSAPAFGQLVLVATSPLGGPAGPAATAAGALDYGREVLGFPDVLGAAEACTDPLVEVLTSGVGERPGGQRRMVVAEHLDGETLRDGLLAALLTDGSTVLVRASAGSAEPDRVVAIARSEHCDEVE